MQSQSALTDVQIRNAKPHAGSQYELWDSKIPGFGVRVSPSGTKAFVLVYRHQGRRRRMTLGRYPDLSLSDARKEAQISRSSLAQGLDPLRQKSADRITDDQRFGNVVSEFIERHAKRKTKSWQQTQQILEKEFVAAFGRRPIDEVTKGDVLGVLERMIDRGAPVAANTAFRTVRKLFNWLVEQGVLSQSPLIGLREPTRVADRDRVLADEELGAVWKAAGEIGYPYGSIIKLLLLTGQRRDEVAQMRWDEIDLEAAHWSIPGPRTKNGKPNEVPLSSLAVDLLAATPDFGAGFVFPARGNPEKAFSGFSKAKLSLDQRSNTSEWRLHDLRRTMATGLARLGTDPHVVEHILNHQTGTMSQIAKIYNRHAYLPEKAKALQIWADHIVAIAVEA